MSVDEHPSIRRTDGVNLANLASMPLLLQVGENDDEYHRNTVTAEYNDKLNALAASSNGGYVHVLEPRNLRSNPKRRFD